MFNFKKFREGAASFYIVAFSTLILLVVATSFAAIIISEITRTSNDDLSQSAYDSAMAGIEDAKLAYYNYQNCKVSPSNAKCNEIIKYVEHPEKGDECNMVGNILGRSTEIQEYTETNTISNNMQQEYTCVMLQTKTKGIESTLNSVNSMRVYELNFADIEKEDGTIDTSGETIATRITKAKISWFSGANLSSNGNNLNYGNYAGGKVVFKPIVTNGNATPPTIAVALVQTGNEFTLGDFEVVDHNLTDRGMVYLVPIDGGSSGGDNNIPEGAFAKSNDKQATNTPYKVKCSKEKALGGGYACSATIAIPKPIGGDRNPNTFMMAVSLPYATPSTDFALEFFCGESEKCATGEGASGDLEDQSQAMLDGVQVVIDSTGRATDLYRRVQVRLEEASGTAFLSIMGPLELLGGSSGDSDYLLEKDTPVTSEYGTY